MRSFVKLIRHSFEILCIRNHPFRRRGERWFDSIFKVLKLFFFCPFSFGPRKRLSVNTQPLMICVLAHTLALPIFAHLNRFPTLVFSTNNNNNNNNHHHHFWCRCIYIVNEAFWIWCRYLYLYAQWQWYCSLFTTIRLCCVRVSISLPVLALSLLPLLPFHFSFIHSSFFALDVLALSILPIIHFIFSLYSWISLSITGNGDH